MHEIGIEEIADDEKHNRMHPELIVLLVFA